MIGWSMYICMYYVSYVLVFLVPAKTILDPAKISVGQNHNCIGWLPFFDFRSF